VGLDDAEGRKEVTRADIGEQRIDLGGIHLGAVEGWKRDGKEERWKGMEKRTQFVSK
jgi:hypothetical protein